EGRARASRCRTRAGRTPARVRPGRDTPSRAPCTRCSRRARRARARTTSPGSGDALALLLLCGFLLRFLVATFGHQFTDRASGCPELHRDHPWVADDLTAVGFHLLRRDGDAVHLDREVVDAGALARGLRLGRLG